METKRTLPYEDWDAAIACYNSPQMVTGAYVREQFPVLRLRLHVDGISDAFCINIVPGAESNHFGVWLSSKNSDNVVFLFSRHSKNASDLEKQAAEAAISYIADTLTEESTI